MNKQRKIDILLISCSLYYLPYLIFEWSGGLGIRDASVPGYYKIIQLLFPFIIIFFFNKKIKIGSTYLGFFSLFFILIALIYSISYEKIISIEVLKIIIFYILLIYLPKMNFKLLKTSTLFKLLIIALFSFFLEKEILPKVFNIKPLFSVGKDIRYLGNMGGPNLFAAYLNWLYTLYYYKIKYSNHAFYKIVLLFLILLYMILNTHSDSGILIFVLINLNIMYNEKKHLIYYFSLIILLYLIIKIDLITQNYYFFKAKILSDGSNLSRINSIINTFGDLEIIRVKNGIIYFNESPFYQILLNFGIIVFFVNIFIYILIYYYEIFKVKDKNLKQMKKIFFYQMLISSIFLPNIYLFPMNILYIFSLKFDYLKKYNIKKRKEQN